MADRNVYADSINVVHKGGRERIFGEKSFDNAIYVNYNGVKCEVYHEGNSSGGGGGGGQDIGLTVVNGLICAKYEV